MFRVVVDGFLAKEVAQFFAEQVKKGAPESLTINVQEWVEWRKEHVDVPSLDDLPELDPD
jgi:hypothetical protein